MTGGSIGRRALLRRAAGMAGGASLLEGAAGPAAQAAQISPAGVTIIASDAHAVVDTTSGKIRGFTRNGIVTFRGVPYGGTTAGGNRFLPPTKPEPWTGIRSTRFWGPVSPQAAGGQGPDEETWFWEPDEGRQGEDCLRLNIWTPALGDGKKRPVMVWFHGGGFTSGSSQQEHFYDGENLSRRGDVVVVSVNHRLGLVGFLNLEEAGGVKYAGSGNAGMLDLVASLEWVRDNIGNFGGDPGSVTIFGQSGGGGKVSCLMAMPSASGLFHKAIVQSGSSLRMQAAADSARLAAAVIAELGLSASQLDQIQTLPIAHVMEAGSAASRRLAASRRAGAPTGRAGWSPCVDGKVLPTHPFDPVAPAISATVPMLIGTVMNESSPSAFNAKLEALTEEELKTRVAERHGGRTEAIIAAYRRAHPAAKPIELLSLISSPRTNAVTQAERKTALGAAPAYMYWFCWHTPMLDGKPRAFHGSELPFVFYNAHTYGANLTGGGPEAVTLAGKLSDAWTSFARTGNPNHKGLPIWPAFTEARGQTMIFDRKCEVKDDPDREERATLSS